MTNSRAAFRMATTVVAAFSLFALTACANPIEQLVQQGTSGALEKLIEQGSGGQVDIDTDGDGGISIQTEDGGSIDFGASATVPDAWPGLPLPEGQLLTAYTSGNEFALTYQTTEAEVDKLIAALKSQGFEEESVTDLGELKNMMLKSADFSLIVGWMKDNNGEFTLQYMVFPVES